MWAFARAVALAVTVLVLVCMLPSAAGNEPPPAGVFSVAGEPDADTPGAAASLTVSYAGKGTVVCVVLEDGATPTFGAIADGTTGVSEVRQAVDSPVENDVELSVLVDVSGDVIAHCILDDSAGPSEQIVVESPLFTMGPRISRPVISNVAGSQSSATTVLVSLDMDEPGVVVCQLHAEGSEPNPSTIESTPSASYQADIVDDGSAHPVAFTFTYALTTTYDGYQVSCTSRGTSGHLAFAARSDSFSLDVVAAITMVAAVQNMNADTYIARVRVSTAIKDGTFYCVVTTSPSSPAEADIVDNAIALNKEGVKAVTSTTDDPLNVRVATTVNPAWYAHCTFRVSGSTFLSPPISSAVFSVVDHIAPELEIHDAYFWGQAYVEAHVELNEDGRVFCIVQDAVLGLSGVDKDHIRNSSEATYVVTDESSYLGLAVESTSDKRFVCFGEDEAGNTSEIVSSPSFSYTPPDSEPPVVTIVSLVQSSRLYATMTVSCTEPATVSCSSNTIPPPSTYTAVENDYVASVYLFGEAQSLTQTLTVALLTDVTDYTVYCAAIDDSFYESAVVTATLVADFSPPTITISDIQQTSATAATVHVNVTGEGEAWCSPSSDYSLPATDLLIGTYSSLVLPPTGTVVVPVLAGDVTVHCTLVESGGVNGSVVSSFPVAWDVAAATVAVASSAQTSPTAISVHVSVSKPVELYCVMFTTSVPSAAAIRGSTTATSVDIAYTMALVIAPGHTGVACTSTDAFGRESEVVSAAVDIDTTPPTIQVTSVQQVSTDSAQVAVTATESATVFCTASSGGALTAADIRAAATSIVVSASVPAQLAVDVSPSDTTVYCTSRDDIGNLGGVVAAGVDVDTTGPMLASVTCEQSKAGVFALDVVVQDGEPIAALKCIIRVTTDSAPTLASILTIGVDAVHVSAGAYTVAASPEDTTTEFRAFCVASDAVANWSPSVAASPVFTYLSPFNENLTGNGANTGSSGSASNSGDSNGGGGGGSNGSGSGLDWWAFVLIGVGAAAALALVVFSMRHRLRRALGKPKPPPTTTQALAPHAAATSSSDLVSRSELDEVKRQLAAVQAASAHNSLGHNRTASSVAMSVGGQHSGDASTHNQRLDLLSGAGAGADAGGGVASAAGGNSHLDPERRFAASTGSFATMATRGSMAQPHSSRSGAFPLVPDTVSWMIPASHVTVSGRVGGGAYGAVFRGTFSGSDVALKQLHADMNDAASWNALRVEASLLSMLRHPHVLHFYGVCAKGDAIFLVTEFCPISLLNFLMDPASDSSLPTCVEVAVQVARGMRYLHSEGIIHRDLKPDNLLLTGGGVIRICDFGLARKQVAHSMTANKGTPAYMAPETISLSRHTGKSQYTTAVDVYSYGITLWTVITRRQPFGHITNPYALPAAVANGERPPIPPRVPPRLRALLTACWSPDPRARPTFPQVEAALMDPDLLSPQPPVSLPSYRNEHLCASKSERQSGQLPALERPPHQQQATSSGAVAGAGDVGAGAGADADAGAGAGVGGDAGAGGDAGVGGDAGAGASTAGSDLSGNPDTTGGVGAAAVLSTVPAVPSPSAAPPRPDTSTPSFHVHDSGSDLTSAHGSDDAPKATPLHLASTATTATLQGATSSHMSPLAAYASMNATHSGGQAAASSSLAAYALSSSGGVQTTSASGGAALHPGDVAIDMAGLGVGQMT